MSFNNLPPNIYILLALSASVALIGMVVRGRFHGEPNIYSMFGMCFAIATLLAAVQKALHFHLKNLERFAWGIEIAMFTFGVFGVIFGLIGVFKYGDEERKKIVKWGLTVFVLASAFVTILILTK